MLNKPILLMFLKSALRVANSVDLGQTPRSAVIYIMVHRDLSNLSAGETTPLSNNNTAEPQWLENLWDHGNSFETWVVRATEG